MGLIGARCDTVGDRSSGARLRRRDPARGHDLSKQNLVAIYKAIKIRQGDNHRRENGNGKDAKDGRRESLAAKPWAGDVLMRKRADGADRRNKGRSRRMRGRAGTR